MDFTLTAWTEKKKKEKTARTPAALSIDYISTLTWIGKKQLKIL